MKAAEVTDQVTPYQVLLADMCMDKQHDTRRTSGYLFLVLSIITIEPISLPQPQQSPRSVRDSKARVARSYRSSEKSLQSHGAWCGAPTHASSLVLPDSYEVLRTKYRDNLTRRSLTGHRALGGRAPHATSWTVE